MSAQSYQPIKSSFRRDQFDFTLIARQGDVALFAKTKPNHSNWSYEVVVIRKVEAKPIMGRPVPAHEAMPCSEDWGTYGWTPYDWDRAWKLFEAKVAEFGFQEEHRWEISSKHRFREKDSELGWPATLGGSFAEPS